MQVSEDSLVAWSKGPGKTEAQKCENAENAVRKAIDGNKDLANLDISVFVQGSYKARTNIRQDSDVDICARYNGAFFPEYPNGKTGNDFGNRDSDLTFSTYKDLVENALKDYFGASAVSRGDKAIHVHANTYRIDADVVPTFEHRLYTGARGADGSWLYFSGVAFKCDSGKVIKNWPQQTYDNGVQRNLETGKAYKRVIRILKRVRSKMQEEDIAAAKDIASFLIESLVWNARKENFTHDTYFEIVRDIVLELWKATRNDSDCSEWVEVNGLKYLFRSTQPWTREAANNFLAAVWHYLGFK